MAAMHPGRWGLVLLGILLAACSPAASSPPASSSLAADASAEPTPTGSPNEMAEPAPTGQAAACGLTIGGAGSLPLAHLGDVRVGTHDGYDRVVFEFVEVGTPAIRLEPVEPPFSMDPSGLPLTVNGSAFVGITLLGGTKMADDGSSTYAGPTEFAPNFPALMELVEAGDFEAVSTWYAGLSVDPCLVVFTLANPSRIVVDVQH